MTRTVRAVCRRRYDGWVALAAIGSYAGLGPLAAGSPGRGERTVFETMQRAGDSLPGLRLPQQLGTPWLLPAMAAAGWVTGRPHLAVSAALALPLEKGLEVGVKKVVRRRRPAQVMDVELHDDAPTDGPSYPSGHAAIASCAAVLALPYLPKAMATVLAGTVGVTAYTRVHQGAHFPLDAVGGILLGTGAGSLLNYTFGLPPKPRGR